MQCLQIFPHHLASQGHWNLRIGATGTKIHTYKQRLGASTPFICVTVHYVLYINYVLDYDKDALLLHHNILHQISLLLTLQMFGWMTNNNFFH
jgi:hypothetical protein